MTQGRLHLLTDSHLLLAVIFTGLALVFLAPSLVHSDNLALIDFYDSLLFVAITPWIGYALHRSQWIISPVIGIAAAISSTLYSTTVTYGGPCSTATISRGFPIAWIHLHAYNFTAGCYLEARQLLPLPTPPNLVFLFFDATFYTILTIAILEFYSFLCQVRTENRQDLTARQSETTGLIPQVQSIQSKLSQRADRTRVPNLLP